MKHAIVAAAILSATLVMPALAQDKPAAEPSVATTPKAKAKSKSRPHSHMEDRQGIKPSEQPREKSGPVDKTKHSHPRDR